MTFTYPSHTTKGCVPLSSDVMFGLTEKIFGEDYYTIKKSIYKELEKLAKQIGAYLDLPQRMVYLQ